MHVNMSVYGIKDCANLSLFDLGTGNPVLFSDYANVSTNEWSAERVYANSKGTRAIAWDYDRQSTLAVEMEVFDLKWIALTAGSEIKKGESNVAKREIIRVGAGQTASLSQLPVDGSVQVVPVNPADEIEHIDVPLDEVTGGDALTSNQFSVTGKDITFSSDAVEGTPYAVYFLTVSSQVKTITISADKFPKNFKVVADALIREKETGNDEFVQIEYPNAKPQSNFTITMSATEPTNLSVTFDLFPNKDKEMAVYKVISE